MFKRILALVCVLLIMASIVAGCGGRKESPVPMQEGYMDNKSDVYNKDVKVGGVTKAFTEDAEGVKNEAKESSAESDNKNGSALTTTGTANETFNNAILNQRKIIRNADVSLEVDDFDGAYARIKTKIAAFGFIQESSIKKDKVYIDSKEKLITKGTIIIRVDKDRFDSVLGDLKGLGTLLFENIKSDDVTDKFFDTESRLRLLRYEESRLEEYLKKITDPDIIFKTESRLTDIRHEIESLTGTLKKWSDLVELSTITINMTEKTPDSKPAKEKSYWGKLADRFSSSFKGVITFCSELLIVLVTVLPVLVFLGIILFAVILFYKKVLKNRFKVSLRKNENTGSHGE